MIEDRAYTRRLFQDLTAGRQVEAMAPLSPAQVQLATYHGLIGVLAHSSDPVLSDPIVFRYLEIIGRQRLMKANLHRILTCFHESGIPAAVLKGPYLAASYAKPALRTFSDIDLLIPQSRLGDALSALRYDPGVRSVPPKKPRADKRDIPIHDPSGFVFNLDLHWDLFSYTQLLGCADGATSWAWDNAVPDPEHEIGPLWHLPPEVRLAFLSAHSVLDHRFRLILFRDLAEVTRNEADWDATHDFASRWGLRSVTHLALRIAKDVANAPISEKRLVELRPHALIMTAAEAFLRRADLVHFVGHSPHPLNLAIVLLHDSRLARIRLALRAPLAVPSWLSRVTSGQNLSAAQRPIIGRPSRILHVVTHRCCSGRTNVRQSNAGLAGQRRCPASNRHDFSFQISIAPYRRRSCSEPRPW